MQISYTNRSNARRAARAAGIDPDLVTKTADGLFYVPAPDSQSDDERPPVDLAAAPADPFEIPQILQLTSEQRAEGWKRNPPKAAALKQEEAMAPAKRPKKPKRESGANKTAVLTGMLSKGATVEALTKATGWLPHTLRARISGLAKPKSQGGLGLKIERDRKDGVTTYRSVA